MDMHDKRLTNNGEKLKWKFQLDRRKKFFHHKNSQKMEQVV